MFGGLAGQVDLNQHLRSAAGLARRPIEAPQEVYAVYRVDPVERRRSLPCLVRLQVSDEVPGNWERGRGHALLQRLLHLVLAKVVQPRFDRGPDVIETEGLRDCDQPDGVNRSFGRGQSRTDPRVDPCKPGGNGLGQLHCAVGG